MILNRLINVSSLLVFCAFTGPLACHAQVIDDFSESPVALTRADTPVFLSQLSLNPSNVIGGSRDIVLGEFGSAGQFVDISDGSLTTDSFSDSLLYLSLTYGSDTSPLGLDLSLTGHDRFSFEDFTGDAIGFFRLSSPTGSSTASLNLLSSEHPFLLFSDFDGGVNFSDISTIEFNTSRNTQTFGFGGIATATAVPEPSSGLAGVICCFVAATRRRRG